MKNFAKYFLPVLSASILLITVPARGNAASACEKLDGDRKRVADQLLDRLRPYECCADSISNCLKIKPACGLVTRLADTVCRAAGDGRPAEEIAKEIELRAESLGPEAPVNNPVTGGYPAIGPSDAPVTVVAYSCLTCPLCGKVVPEIYRLAESGPLKNKIRFVYKPFPLSGHLYAAEGSRALMVANHFNMFWPYALAAFAQMKEPLSPRQLSELAGKIGLDRKKFDKLIDSIPIRRMVVDSKYEATFNAIRGTPTIYINGKELRLFPDAAGMADLIEEEIERSEGKYGSAKND